MTLLFVALLQRRAFFLTFGDHGRYKWAFTSPHIINQYTSSAPSQRLAHVTRLNSRSALLRLSSHATNPAATCPMNPTSRLESFTDISI